MPSDTIYFGIVREPYSQFVSTIHYFRPPYIFSIPGSDPVSIFMKNPELYEPRVKHSSTNNRQSFEFGFPPDIIQSRDVTKAEIYIQKLAREFKLVLVAEHLPESILLMKRYLNLKTKDVIYVTKNTWAQLDTENKVMLNKNFYVNKTTEIYYRRWAIIDYMLYDFFLKRLRQQIQAEGPDFPLELSHFKVMQERIERFCFTESRPFRFARLSISESNWNEGFEVTSTDCSQLCLSEKDFHDELVHVQYGEL